MKKRIGAIVISLLIFGIIMINGGCKNNTSGVTTAVTGVNTGLATAANGLSLTLTLDDTHYKYTQDVLVNIDVKNTLSKTNIVNSADNWQSYGMGPCTYSYPVSIALVAGNYTESVFPATGTFILYNPNEVYSCPNEGLGYMYKFRPLSDIADEFYNTDPQSTDSFEIQLNKAVDLNGYWTGNAPTAILNSFEPGVYTVVVEDEWGSIVRVNFTVIK